MSKALLPYKVVALLCWGEVPGVRHVDARFVIVKTAELSLFMGVPSSRLRAHFEQAEAWGMLQDLSVSHGVITCRIAPLKGTT